jgi:OOP family OmpA-OmpF porin
MPIFVYHSHTIKMKKLLFLFSSIFLHSLVYAQNLVPNYSFENYTKCVNAYVEFNGYVSNWIGSDPSGGLSYCTSQCPDSSMKDASASIPYNCLGFEYARTGVSYIEMETFVNNTNDTAQPFPGNGYKDYRNYIEAKLTDSLLPGISYYVTFFVSLADSSDFACSDIGAYISDSAIKFNSFGLVESKLIPQVNNDPIKQPLIDTMNWMKVSGSFIAKGGEKYILIGNFKKDSLSNIKYLKQRGVGYTAAYYYIDDVFVSTDSITGLKELIDNREEVKTYPNPSSDGIFTIVLKANSDRLKVAVYNILGEEVYSRYSIPSTQFSIDISNQPSGIYFYRITDENGSILKADKLLIVK